MIPISEDVEKVATKTVDAAYKVHSLIGSGLLESAYQACLIYELKKRGLSVECQVSLPINYDDNIIGNAYRIDLLVENCLIVELKAVEEITPDHISQVLTYLKFSNLRLGLIFNFNKKYFKDIVRRIVR